MGRREDNKTEKRARLEEAAVAVFVAEGFAGATVERVIERAGVARGTFYLYFRDKQALFEAVAERLLGPVTASIEKARDDLAACERTEETRPIYQRLGTEIGMLMAGSPRTLQALLAEARSPGSAGACVRSWLDRHGELTRQILADATARGLLRPHDHGVVARAILGAIERLAWETISRGEAASPDSAAEIVELFRRGLEPG